MYTYKYFYCIGGTMVAHAIAVLRFPAKRLSDLRIFYLFRSLDVSYVKCECSYKKKCSCAYISYLGKKKVSVLPRTQIFSSRR